MSDPVYKWYITVRHWNTYFDKVVSQTPVVILGSTKEEVTNKVHKAFNAKRDAFREQWSHDWTLQKVKEVKWDSAPSD